MNTSSAEMLIIADDLSGAADCAVACHAAGLSSLVMLDPSQSPPYTEALAVDTDSRRLPVRRAAEISARVIDFHAGKSTRIIFKKVDSTLRGHVGAEIAACLAIARRRPDGQGAVAIVAPAFPGAGRTTRDGRQLVNGIPVENTEIWQHEGKTGLASLPDMLTASGLRTVSIDLATIRARNRLAQILIEAGRNSDALICDAEADSDLEAIAIAGQELGRGSLWVGSAGLARQLPKAAGLLRTRSQTVPKQARSGPVICVIGSMSNVSREQFRQLAKVDGLISLTIPPDVLLAGTGSDSWEYWNASISAAIGNGTDIAILLGAEVNDNSEDALFLSTALASIVAPFAAQAGGLIATGGETARALLLALKIASIQLAGEVEPGIPLSLVVDRGQYAGLPVITKAGAFGSPGSLLHCRNFLCANQHVLSVQD